ncbi:hypothetical protein [Corynebacterium sp. LK2510]|uniref:hypothetical protein n=1 Tax=Corynebacterium sp. LK2510 TaxID=3110472 RepID=UPI0034CEEF09
MPDIVSLIRSGRVEQLVGAVAALITALVALIAGISSAGSSDSGAAGPSTSASPSTSVVSTSVVSTSRQQQPVEPTLVINYDNVVATYFDRNVQVVFNGTPYPNSYKARNFRDVTLTIGNPSVNGYTKFSTTLGWNDADSARSDAAYFVAEIYRNGKLVESVRVNRGPAVDYTYTINPGTDKLGVRLRAYRADHVETSLDGVSLGTPKLS